MKRNSALKKLALNRRRRLSFSLCSLQNTNMDESAAKTLPVSAASCPSEASPAKALRSLEHLSLSVCPQSLGFFFPTLGMLPLPVHRVSSRSEGQIVSSLRFEVAFVLYPHTRRSAQQRRAAAAAAAAQSAEAPG